MKACRGNRGTASLAFAKGSSGTTPSKYHPMDLMALHSCLIFPPIMIPGVNRKLVPAGAPRREVRREAKVEEAVKE